MPEYYVEGFEDWEKKLAQLPARMEKNVYTAATRAGGSQYIKIARANLGGGYNTLKKSLKVKKLRSRPGLIKFRVHPERGKGATHDGWYAHIAEFGSFRKPGGWDIPTNETSKSGRRNFAVLGANLVFSKVHHPGIKGTRFMSRALSREAEIIAAMVKKGNQAFDKQIKRAWLQANG